MLHMVCVEKIDCNICVCGIEGCYLVYVLFVVVANHTQLICVMVSHVTMSSWCHMSCVTCRGVMSWCHMLWCHVSWCHVSLCHMSWCHMSWCHMLDGITCDDIQNTLTNNPTEHV